jgi:hypothetical protein
VVIETIAIQRDCSVEFISLLLSMLELAVSFCTHNEPVWTGKLD